MGENPWNNDRVAPDRAQDTDMTKRHLSKDKRRAVKKLARLLKACRAYRGLVGAR